MVRSCNILCGVGYARQFYGCMRLCVCAFSCQVDNFSVQLSAYAYVCVARYASSPVDSMGLCVCTMYAYSCLCYALTWFRLKCSDIWSFERTFVWNRKHPFRNYSKNYVTWENLAKIYRVSNFSLVNTKESLRFK